MTFRIGVPRSSVRSRPSPAGPRYGGARTIIRSAPLLVLAAAASACQGPKASSRESIPVRVEAAQPAGVLSGIRYSANILPHRQVSLAFKSGGYIREILKMRGPDGSARTVQAGDVVRAGTVLARVRETEYAERVEKEKSSVAEASAALEKQRLDFARAKSLYESRSLSKADFDGAQAAFDAAQARLQGSKAVLAASQTALDDAALTAPMDGVVLARNVEEGSLVGAGTVGFTLADTTSVKALFGVPDSERSLRIGQALTLAVEALPGARFEGRITAIAPSADATSRVFDVEVTVPNKDGRLRTGMIAAVETPREGGAGVSRNAAVPLTSIVKAAHDPSGYAVFVVTGDDAQSVAHLRSVKLGEIAGNRISVTDGLATGERVVTTGATILTDGDAVRIIP